MCLSLGLSTEGTSPVLLKLMAWLEHVDALCQCCVRPSHEIKDGDGHKYFHSCGLSIQGKTTVLLEQKLFPSHALYVYSGSV